MYTDYSPSHTTSFIVDGTLFNVTMREMTLLAIQNNSYVNYVGDTISVKYDSTMRNREIIRCNCELTNTRDFEVSDAWYNELFDKCLLVTNSESQHLPFIDLDKIYKTSLLVSTKIQDTAGLMNMASTLVRNHEMANQLTSSVVSRMKSPFAVKIQEYWVSSDVFMSAFSCIGEVNCSDASQYIKDHKQRDQT